MVASTSFPLRSMKVLFFALLVANSVVPMVGADALDDAITNAMAELNVKGASILWYDKNKSSEPILRAYGKTAASENSADVATDTTFMLASISKVFAGAAVAILVDQGTISLDDDICNVLPSQYQGTSACRHYDYPDIPITWRMLVTHRSSFLGDIPLAYNENGDEVEASYAPTEANPACPLTDVRGFYRDFLVDKETETTVGSELIAEGGDPLNWYDLGEEDGGAYEFYPPGDEVLYSNFAIGYVAALVEHATGESFQDFCKNSIFDPLGMQHTSWFREDLPQGTSVATPVEYLGNNRFEDYGHYCYIDYASGQLYTSVEDLNKFCSSMLNLGAPTLWSQETGSLYTTCQERDGDGNEVGECEFGLTWEIVSDSYRGTTDEELLWLKAFEQYDWEKGVMHSGAEAGVQTQLIVLPTAGVYAAVLTNTDGNDELAAQVLTAILADPTSSASTRRLATGLFYYALAFASG